METIYIMEPGCYVRREGRALCVVKQNKVIDRLPAEGLQRLILVGNVNLTGGLLDFLIHQQVETVFMTPTGRFRARVGINEHRHVALRRAQYQRLSDPGFAARTARAIVHGKLRGMIRLLLLRGRQFDDEILRAAAAGLKPLCARLEKEADLERIRGFEGAATRMYFQCYGRLIRNEAFSFNGRNRRPPLDPVNALLSFVYTLLTNEVASAINACGLDPYMGSLHEISYGRPSLACDLVEEYRVLGDRLVLGLVNRKAVGPEDFIMRGGAAQAAYIDEAELASKRPVEMRPPIRRIFVAAYEQMMKREVSWGTEQGRTSYRRLIMHQVRRFAEYLLNPDQAYVPFVMDI